MKRLIFILFSLFACESFGADNVMDCHPALGIPTRIQANNIFIDAPSDGSSPLGTASTWDEPIPTKVVCYGGEPGATINNEKWYQLAFSNDDTYQHNGKEYIRLNEYIGIAAEVFVLNRNYLPMDSSGRFWSNQSKNKVTLDEMGAFISDVGSGQKGKIYLHIIKPFVGTQLINDFHLGNVRAALFGPSELSTVITSIYLTGEIKSDSSCTFNEDVYSVDFDEFTPGALGSASSPNNALSKTLHINLSCTGPMTTKMISMAIIGEKSADDPRLIKTNKPRLGIMTRSGDKVITPLDFDGVIPTDENLISTEGSGGTRTSVLNFTPVRISDGTIGVGQFAGSATLKVEFE